VSCGFAGFDALVTRIAALPGNRVMVAVSGPPGAGKSTLSEALCTALNASDFGSASVIPMDGFHLDDVVLDTRGLRARKGAPQTFDVAGFRHLLARLQHGEEDEVAIPVFDRNIEISRAGASIVRSDTRILLVEGNYLLLKDAPWNGLAAFFDLAIMIREPRALLEARLLDRWHGYGFSAAAAAAKVADNDMPNVDLVLQNSIPADVETNEI
jgi:pantothenate kinase